MANSFSGITMQLMTVLVDYDNLEKALRKPGGLVDFCNKLVSCISSAVGIQSQRIRFRLYGGWYDGSYFTRHAQRLTAEVQATFPATVRWSNQNVSGNCLVSVEMAYSLEVEPARHLFHTLRTRSFGALIQCDPAAYASCVEPSCPVKHVVDFLAKQKCTIQSCNVSQADLLRKTEQKLVDTMLTSDLLFFATLGQRELIVVSSDDDLWPGIRTALGIGASVTLVHTRPTRTLPGEYTRGLPMSFKQLAL